MLKVPSRNERDWNDPRRQVVRTRPCYTREEWDAVDSPPLTPEQLAQARPFAEVFPELAETLRRNVADRRASESLRQT